MPKYYKCPKCSKLFPIDKHRCPHCNYNVKDKQDKDKNIRTAGGLIGGAILGASLAGLPGAIIGGIIGTILVGTTKKSKDGDEKK